MPERSVCQIPALAAGDRRRAGPVIGRGPRGCCRSLSSIETVALLPDHPPASFTWRGIRRRVRRADGPERVFGEWWKRDAELAAVRDYFRVEDEAGERYWLFRAGDGEDRRDRHAPLVPAWDLRMSSAALCRTAGDLAFQLPARRIVLRGAVCASGRRSASRRSAVVDRNSLAGIVRAHEAAKATGVRLDRRLPPRPRRRHVAFSSTRPIAPPTPGSAGCSRSARGAAARPSATSTGPISSPTATA